MKVLTRIPLLAAILLCAQVARADGVPSQVTDANDAIQTLSGKILKFAYPTAQANTSDPAATWGERLGGYYLDEKFRYTDSNGDAQSFTLRFNLDHDGKVTSVSEKLRSELWPTFATGNLLLAAIKAAAQDQVDTARREHRDPPPVAVLILKAGNINDIVAILVNAQL
jgi:hypothetical protein